MEQNQDDRFIYTPTTEDRDITIERLDIRDCLGLTAGMLIQFGVSNEEIQSICNDFELVLRYVYSISYEESHILHHKVNNPTFDVLNYIFRVNETNTYYLRKTDFSLHNIVPHRITEQRCYEILHEYHTITNGNDYIPLDDLMFCGTDDLIPQFESPAIYAPYIPFPVTDEPSNINQSVNERKKAEEKAKKLFLSHLTDNQKKTHNEHGYIELKSSINPAIRFKLYTHRLDYNVEILLYNRSMGMFCCQMKGGVELPNYDHFMAQKIWLENNEEEFIRTSNIK